MNPKYKQKKRNYKNSGVVILSDLKVGIRRRLRYLLLYDTARLKFRNINILIDLSKNLSWFFVCLYINSLLNLLSLYIYMRPFLIWLCTPRTFLVSVLTRYITTFLQSTDLLSKLHFNDQMLLSPAEYSLSHPVIPGFALKKHLLFFSHAAPQSVLLLRLHHGRMPDSLYGKLSSLCLVTHHCHWAFKCIGPCCIYEYC